MRNRHKKLRVYCQIILGSILFLSLFSPLVEQNQIESALAAPALAPAYAVTPKATLSVPGSVMIGEDFTFTVSFKNNGASGETGYGPFIDIYFPVQGIDGDPAAIPAEAADGIDFDSTKGVTYSGEKLDCVVNTFNASGKVTHPYVKDSSGTKIKVNGTYGDKLVSCLLPFGSFVPGQPAVVATVNAKLNKFADMPTPLTIRTRGGFMYGANPLDDWCCGDLPIVESDLNNSPSWPGADVTPQVFSFAKSYAGPSNKEDETATGPNYLRQYTLTVDIATGQSITDLDVTDLLPDNIQFVSIDASTTTGYSATSTPSASTPGGTLTLRYASVTGTSSTADVKVVFNFYVPRLDASSGAVINATSGDDVTSSNIAWGSATWTPDDPRDTPTTVSSDATCPTCPPLHTLTDKSIAIQKSVANKTDSNNDSPGDTLEYTLVFQVSDYFAFDTVVLTDVISDGQHFDTTYVPELAVNGNTYTLAAVDMNAANYDISCNYTGASAPTADCTSIDGAANDGKTTFTFRASDELITRGKNGRMVGGCIDPATGSNPPDCTAQNDGATTGTITFRTVIQEVFSDTFPSGDNSVDQGDKLDNTVTINGNVLNTGTFVVVGVEADDATDSISIPRKELSKTIYAINGDTNSSNWPEDSGGRVEVKPNDTLTYRLTYDLSTGDVEDMTLEDYLPLPVFYAADPDANDYSDPNPHDDGPAWVFDDTKSATPPAAGHAHFGPSDTFDAYITAGLSGATGSLTANTGNTTPTRVPVLASDASANKLSIAYANYDDTRNSATEKIDLLFTVTVSHDPFADGLYITNQAHVQEGSTNAGSATANALLKIVVTQPVLRSGKSVIWTDNANATFSPSTTGPVTFSGPSNTPRWAGTISSNGIAANPINSNVSDIDSGDIVTFAIFIENQGSSLEGAFDIAIQDQLPSLFQVPANATGLNLQIYYGDGSGPISYTKPDDTVAVAGDLFIDGIKLVDPVGQGACQAHDPNLGNNIIMITYDLQVKPTNPGTVITNNSSLTNYASYEGGPSHIQEKTSGTFPDNYPDKVWDVAIKDSAKATISDPAISKTITATSATHTNLSEGNAALPDLAIGEVITFEIVATLPEATSTSLTITDKLPPLTDADGYLQAISSCVVSIGANLTPTNSPPGYCPTTWGTHSDSDGSGDGINDLVVFDFGAVTNAADGVEDAKDKITVQVVARVGNHSGNQNGDTLTNTVEITQGSVTTTGTADVEIVEPELQIDKAVNDAFPATGQNINFTLTIDHTTTSTADAFDVSITDTLPAGLTLDLATVNVALSGGATGLTNSTAGNKIDVAVSTFPQAGKVIITFTANVTAAFNSTMNNKADLTWTSLSGTDANERTGTGTGPNDHATNDSVTIGIYKQLVKSLLATDEFSFTTHPQVAIGEILTYEVRLTIPMNNTDTYKVVDTLGSGLAFVDCAQITAGADITSTKVDFTDANNCNHGITSGTHNPLIQNSGGLVTFDFGDVTNAHATDTQEIVITYRVIVLDIAANITSVSLVNEAEGQWPSGSQKDSATAVTILEPDYSIQKWSNTTSSFPGGTVKFYLDVQHTPDSTADGFDVEITDPLPSGLIYVPGTLKISSGWDDGGTVNLDDSNPAELHVIWDNFPLGESATVEFDVQIALNLAPGSSVTNTAALAWTSLPSDLSLPRSAYHPNSTERFYDPPSSVNIYSKSSSFLITIKASMPDTGFAPGRETDLRLLDGDRPQQLAGIWLQIPTYEQRIPVMGIPLTDEGWDLTWLSSQAGHLAGTAYPTWVGNTVLTGHAYLANGLPGPFEALRTMRWGDEIYLYANGQRYTYQVRDVSIAAYNDFSSFEHKSDDWLTLLSCYDFSEKTGAYRWRQVVSAVLVNVENID